MYKFTTTERNTGKANDYETKSTLHLLTERKDSDEIDFVLVDCCNDVTGVNSSKTKLWDVQSKNVKSLNPKKIGESLITLFQNYISDLEFHHYILFMPELNELYLKNSNLTTYRIDNFKQGYLEKIKESLGIEYERRNKKQVTEDQKKNFINEVTFTVGKEDKDYYIKKIIDFKNKDIYNQEFYFKIFDEIRSHQSDLKNIVIEGKEIETVDDIIKLKKVLTRKKITTLVLNRVLGISIFQGNVTIPNHFMEEAIKYTIEERKELIMECNSSLARVFFDKNSKKIIWKFFEELISIILNNLNLTAHKTLELLKKKEIKFPRQLNDISILYLISILKGELEL